MVVYYFTVTKGGGILISLTAQASFKWWYIYRYRGTQRAPTHSQERKISK